ncbi:MAG: M23 family metallopeptidase [Myxococcales bacterium]|nr:M23 family metallopeptidase [Myxococcales bacterium]MDH5566335.1 M23 family metallopeptidase [Myxococcales bacterium]
MDTFSLIVVSDETSPVRRFEVRKTLVKRCLWGAGIAAALLVLLLVDYVRVRVDNRELDGLRSETIERREQVAEFQKKLRFVDTQLSRLQEFERKVRIIANLPGSAGTGGEEITEVGADAAPPQGGDELGDAMEETRLQPASQRIPVPAPDASEPERVSLLDQGVQYLGAIAESQEASLAELVTGLEGKRRFLASSPSIWPAQGWLTSRFGNRVSPFTGRNQFHAGIDIAGAPGTAVVAPARGKVVFAGKRGPLGNSIIIDHGYGVRTQYGHAKDVFVKRGMEVERGTKIASLGNSGRSTGPHLHYVVEVNGKTRNPLDYIFD